MSPGCALTIALCSSAPDATEIVAAIDADDVRREPVHRVSAVRTVFMGSLPETAGQSGEHAKLSLRATQSVSGRDYRS